MTTTTERMLPLYEGKMLAQFDHRDADVVKSPTAAQRQNQPRYLTEQDHIDPERLPIPLNWVSEAELPKLDVSWLSGFSDVTSATNRRTVLSAALPVVAVNHKYPLFFGQDRDLLICILNSFILDYVSRQKVAGQNLTYTYLRQLPIINPSDLRVNAPWNAAILSCEWLRRRSLELMYTSWDMQPYAVEVGDASPPYIWDSERREGLRSEIDAALFHLYGIIREDLDYIMDTFPIVKRKDEAAFGEFKTKRLILEAYDAMQLAIDTGVPFESTLNPPPGQGPRHPAKAAAS